MSIILVENGSYMYLEGYIEPKLVLKKSLIPRTIKSIFNIKALACAISFSFKLFDRIPTTHLLT